MIGISIEPDFSEDDIEKIIEEFLNRVVRIIKNELSQIGLEAISEARLKSKQQGGFDDQTGNLRSSMYYCLIYNGEIIIEDFEASNKGSDKQSGIESAKKASRDIASEDNEGWGIVIGAAMEYASWVEAKGFDVITGATLSAESKLKRAMQNVINAFK